MKSAGKAGIIKMIENDYKLLQNRKILLIVDYCAFGSNIDDLICVCESKNVKVICIDKYKSFDYLLLRTNLVNDMELDDFTDVHRLEYNSLENLYTDRLSDVTMGKYYKYSKSPTTFPNCYYDKCCTNKLNKGNCDKRKYFTNSDKFHTMLVGTEFEDLLEL